MDNSLPKPFKSNSRTLFSQSASVDLLEDSLEDDFIAEALVSAAPTSPVNPLLKHRVMTATEPMYPRVVTDPKGSIISVSIPFTEMCGYSFEEIRGRKPGDFLQGPLTEPEAVETLRQAILHEKSCQVELWNYHKNGNPYRVRIELHPVLFSNGRCAGYEAVETCIQPAASN